MRWFWQIGGLLPWWVWLGLAAVVLVFTWSPAVSKPARKWLDLGFRNAAKAEEERQRKLLISLLEAAPSEGDYLQSREELQAAFLLAHGVRLDGALTQSVTQRQKRGVK